jgi:hypothetical protein
MIVTQIADGVVSLGVVKGKKAGIAVKVRAASDLGGGTITIGMRPSGDVGVIEALDATLVADSSATYTIGSDIELFATLASATDPDIEYIVGQF